MPLMELFKENRRGGGSPRWGNVLKVYPGNASFQTELQVATPTTSDATVPKTTSAVRLTVLKPGQSQHTHFTTNDQRQRHYRARHILPGFCDGTFTDFVNAIPVLLSGIDQQWGDDGGEGTRGGGGGGEDDETILFFDEARRRGDTFYEGDRKLKNIVTVSDTGGDFALNRHTESGVGQNSSAQTFNNPFESPPTVVFIPQKGMTFSNTTELSTGRQFVDMAAEDLTVSGFTLRAVLATSAAGTTFDDGFSAAQNATDPENGDVNLLADGAVAFSNLEDANATVTTYNAFFDVESTLMDGDNFVTVEFGFNASATSTSFTIGASRQYGSGIVNDQDETLSFVTALGADYDVRIRISYLNNPGINLAQVGCHGEDSTTPGVQYTAITAGTEETMTPLTGQQILWQATETP